MHVQSKRGNKTPRNEMAPADSDCKWLPTAQDDLDFKCIWCLQITPAFPRWLRLRTTPNDSGWLQMTSIPDDSNSGRFRLWMTLVKTPDDSGWLQMTLTQNAFGRLRTTPTVSGRLWITSGDSRWLRLRTIPDDSWWFQMTLTPDDSNSGRLSFGTTFADNSGRLWMTPDDLESERLRTTPDNSGRLRTTPTSEETNFVLLQLRL